MIEINIGAEEQEQRLDRFLKKFLPKASLGHVYKIIRTKVRVNGKKAKPEQYLKKGDVLALYLPEDALEAFLKPEKESAHSTALRQFTVVYEDGAAVFFFNDEGCIIWQDENENAGEGLQFNATNG